MQVRVAPGASDPAGQATVPTLASVTETDESVTLPVLVTAKVYGTVDPAALPVGVPATLTRVIRGTRGVLVNRQ